MDFLIEFAKDAGAYISGLWHAIKLKTPIYHYIIEDIQLQERGGQFFSLIYYRPIGSRNISYARATDLNQKNIFSEFMPEQAQAIVTLATLEEATKLDKVGQTKKYKEYIRLCAQQFRQKTER